MKSYFYALVLAVVCVPPAIGAIKDEIAAIDKVLVRTCEVAELNAASSKRDFTVTFLRTLSFLEKQYVAAKDQDAVLACRKAREKYDPTAEKVESPIKIPEQLRSLESTYLAQLETFDSNQAKTIAEAQALRRRKLTALHKGLEERGEKESAQLVLNALKTIPLSPKPPAEGTKAASPKPDTSPTAGRNIVPQDVTYLTYARAEKRWEKMGSDAAQGVRRTIVAGATTLHYAEGEHALLKVLWPDKLEVGDRFTVELKGANSVELVDLEGADANARTSLPTTDAFVKVEIVREKDQLKFTCNGQPQKPFYASGKLRGDDAQSALLGASLRAGFSVKKGEQASFQNAKIVRP